MDYSNKNQYLHRSSTKEASYKCWAIVATGRPKLEEECIRERQEIAQHNGCNNKYYLEYRRHCFFGLIDMNTSSLRTPKSFSWSLEIETVDQILAYWFTLQTYKFVCGFCRQFTLTPFFSSTVEIKQDGKVWYSLIVYIKSKIARRHFEIWTAYGIFKLWVIWTMCSSNV